MENLIDKRFTLFIMYINGFIIIPYIFYSTSTNLNGIDIIILSASLFCIYINYFIYKNNIIRGPEDDHSNSDYDFSSDSDISLSSKSSENYDFDKIITV